LPALSSSTAPRWVVVFQAISTVAEVRAGSLRPM
jgi:hypothetical protein